MLLAKNFVQIPAAAQKIQHGAVPCCIFMEFPVPGRNQGLLLFPGIEPHAHQQTALDIGQVLLLEITEDLRAFGAGLDHDAPEGFAALPEQLDALGGVDAQVDDIQVTGDFVERLEFLAHAVDRIALFQQSLLDLVGVFFRVEGISHHGECIHLHDLFQIHLLQPPLKSCCVKSIHAVFFHHYVILMHGLL